MSVALADLVGSTRPTGAAGSAIMAARGDSAATRIVIGAGTLGSLAIGVAGHYAQLPVLQAVFLVAFAALGLGSTLWQFSPWLRVPSRLALGFTTSFVLLTLASSAMVLTGSWFPTAFMVALVMVAVPAHVVGLAYAVRDLRARDAEDRACTPIGSHRSASPVDSAAADTVARRRLRFLLPGRAHAVLARPWLGAASPLVGLVLSLGVALGHRHTSPRFGGVPLELGFWWITGVGLILASIVLIRRREAVLALAVGCLLLVLTLTPAIVYDGPRSQSSAKHIDLVWQIQSLGHLASTVEVYNSWPGFFSTSALLVNFAGIADPMQLARFWPVLIGLFRLVALRYFFGKILRNPLQAWIGVTIALLADPQGADYFSPQSLGLVLGLVTFGLALAHRRTATRLLLIFATACALALTHQLSPYIVGGALVVLVLFGLVRPWAVPALVLVPALTWALMHAGVVESFVSWGQFGRPENFRPPATAASAGLQRLPIVWLTIAALVLSVLVVGALAAATLRKATGSGFLGRLVRGRLESIERVMWACAVCAGVGLLVVMANPYGQEGLFRAVLFGTPWLAVMAARQFPVAMSPLRRLGLAIITGVLCVTFCVACFGLDRLNYVRLGDLGGLWYFAAQGTPAQDSRQYLLVLGQGDLPTTPLRQDQDQDLVSRDTLRLPVRHDPDADPAEQVETLTSVLLAYTGQPADRAQVFALWSPTQQAFAAAYGVQTESEFGQLRDAFVASPYWRPAFEQDGTVVFRFVGSSYSAAMLAGKR